MACTRKAPEQGALILGQASGLAPDDRVYAYLYHQEGDVGYGEGRLQVRTPSFSAPTARSSAATSAARRSARSWNNILRRLIDYQIVTK